MRLSRLTICLNYSERGMPSRLQVFLAANPDAEAEYDEALAAAARREAARADRAELVVSRQKAMLELMTTNEEEYRKQIDSMMRQLMAARASSEGMLLELETLRFAALCKAVRIRSMLPMACATQARTLQSACEWGR